MQSRPACADEAKIVPPREREREREEERERKRERERETIAYPVSIASRLVGDAVVFVVALLSERLRGKLPPCRTFG